MNRMIVGLLVPIVGTLYGFTWAGGRVSSLFHLSELLIILSFVIGGMILAYGGADIREMLRCAVDGGTAVSRERLKRNVLICEGASKFSLYGGFTACFLGILITMGAVSGDVSMVGEKIGAALTGLVFGAAIAGAVFQPLKFRFLSSLSDSEDAQGDKQRGDA